MKKLTRKEVIRDIERRIDAGESKRTVYSSYAMTEWESIARRRLATLVTVSNRKKYRKLNNILVAIVSFIIITNVVETIGICIADPIPGLIGGAVALAIKGLILYGIVRLNFMGYYVLVCLGMQGIGRLIEPVSKGAWLAVFDLAVTLSAMALAVLLLRKLLPNTSLLLKPKTDALDAPVFED